MVIILVVIIIDNRLVDALSVLLNAVTNIGLAGSIVKSLRPPARDRGRELRKLKEIEL